MSAAVVCACSGRLTCYAGRLRGVCMPRAVSPDRRNSLSIDVASSNPPSRDDSWMILRRGDLLLEFFPQPDLDPVTS